MQTMMKRALLLALMLVLMLGQAAAEQTMTAKAFLEQLMLPAALENKEERFTAAELKALKIKAEEQGFVFSRELGLKFEAYGGAFKHSIMQSVLADSLGFYPSTWPIEDQAWFEALVYRAGVWPLLAATVPQQGDISREEALSIAREAIRTAYGEPENLLDEARWRLHTTYREHRESPEVAWRQWEIWFEPLQLELNAYTLLVRNDGHLISKGMEPGTRADQADPQHVQSRYQRIYGDMSTWTVDTWLAFQQDLKAAIDQADPSLPLGSLPVFVMQEYLRPGEGMLSAELAIAAAAAHPEAPRNVELAESSALLLMDEDTPVWKVRIIPSLRKNGFVLPFLAEVDALTGEVRTVRQTDAQTYSLRRDFQLDRYLEEDGTPPAPQPTARPDGKPWYWYSDRAPGYFWEAMDKMYDQNELTDLLNQWISQYGSNQSFWPLEAQALAGLTFDNTGGLEGPVYGLSGEKDISQEEAVALARQALLKEGREEQELEALLPGVSFYYTENSPSGREYMISFYQYTGSEYHVLEVVTLDAESGEVQGTGGNG